MISFWINKYILFKNTYLTKFILIISRLDFIKIVFKKFKLHNPFKRFLISKKIDLIIFNSPSNYVLYCEDLNYIANIWNTELRTFNNFPEFFNGNFNYQDKIIKSIVKYAFKILVFSNKNKDDLVKYYNCFSDKIIIQNLIPHLPALYESQKNSVNYNHLFELLLLCVLHIKFLFDSIYLLELTSATHPRVSYLRDGKLNNPIRRDKLNWYR